MIAPLWARCLLGWLLLVATIPLPAWATSPVTLGIYNSRSEAIMRLRFEPLADYLSRAIGEPVELLLLSEAELDQALAANRLDFVLTNPSHFLIIRSERSLSGVLATLNRRWQGVATASLGGVIIAASDRAGVEGLASIRDKTLVAPSVNSLGGYLAQALELQQIGVDIRRSNRIKLVGSHDRVIRAVLAGDADVGFIRTGILEQLALTQPELMVKLDVVNPQRLAGFPFMASTRLYPEWPLVALPHVDDDIVRRTASALFALEPDDPAAQAADIAGFLPPADYQAVEYLSRSLKVPPFDQAPELTWIDALHQYRLWVFTIMVLLLMLVASSLWLAKRRRQLLNEQRRTRRLMMSWPQPMLVIRRGVFVDCNHAAIEMLGVASREALIGGEVASFSPEYQPDGQDSEAKMRAIMAMADGGLVCQQEWLFRHSDGSDIWVVMTIAPAHEPGATNSLLLCSWHDITDRRQTEQRQRLAASVFDTAREAIFISDRYGRVVDVNEGYANITRQPKHQALGKLPPLPLGEGSGVFQNARISGFWRGEVVFNRTDGEQLDLVLTLSRVCDDTGSVTHFIGIYNDVTDSKAKEHELRTLAHYDALTGLPNRVLFADRLQQGMAQARRHNLRLAVVYIDLDELKPVNDTFGHEAGDMLLIETAERLQQSLREEDTLARMGGDEFTAIILNIDNEADLERLLSRMLVAVAEPVWAGDHQVEISASIGYTVFPQQTEIDGDQLLCQADQAMYQAKRQGKGCFRRFFPDISA